MMMALIDVVKCEVNDKELVYKFPSEDLRIGTQLVVYTGQTAFFVKGGKVMDQFESGTYTLKTENNDSIRQDIKYLVVIEGQASADGYNTDDWHNNDVLSYQRALELHKFWQTEAGIDFSSMNRCELVISGSGIKGVPRDTVNEVNNQRFLIHIVPVIGNIRLE